MFAVCVLLFSEAVTVAVWFVEIVPAVAVKVAVVEPDVTVTVPGTVSAPTLLDSPTATPPVPAALDSVTVQVDPPPVPRLVGLQDSPLTNTGGTSVMFAVCELPFSEAVTVAVWFVEIVPAVAVNVAVVEPDATVTVPGTVSAPTLLDSPTATPPVPAALDSVTVQVDPPPVPRLVGLQDSPLTNTGGTSVMFAVCVLLFSEAVTVAVWFVEIVPAVAVNVAVVEPDATVTVPGTVSAPTLLDSPTATPPVPAATDRVTVQVDPPPVTRLVGLQDSALTTGATNEMFAVCVLLFSEAVTVAVWFVEIVPAVAVNVAVVEPDATVTVPGTVNAPTLLDSETVALPAGAAPFSETVQVEVPLEDNDVGAQLRRVRVGGGGILAVIVPPEPLTLRALPEAVLPSALVTPIDVLVTVDAMVAVTTATTPFCITVALSPARIQE
jgi:uncharacterized membrane protein YjdF